MMVAEASINQQMMMKCRLLPKFEGITEYLLGLLRCHTYRYARENLDENSQSLHYENPHVGAAAS